MKNNHLHKYKKVNLSQTRKPYLVYKCMVPFCNHYVPINLAEGKICECNKCSEPMVITREVLTHSSGNPAARPKCPNCIVRKNARDLAALQEFIAGNKT